MILRPITPATTLGHAQTLLAACLDCGGHVRSDTGYCDLEGPPFKAYYCAECGAVRRRPALPPVQRLP